VVATVVVATIVDHHGVVPGFIALGVICAVATWPIAVFLIASKKWAPVRDQPQNTAADSAT
jgi:hypothetical protein